MGRSRNESNKRKVMTPLLDRLLVCRLMPEKRLPLFYEILYGLDFQNLTTGKQLFAIEAAKVYVNINQLSERQADTAEEKRIRREDRKELPALRSELIKLLAALDTPTLHLDGNDTQDKKDFWTTPEQ